VKKKEMEVNDIFKVLRQNDFLSLEQMRNKGKEKGLRRKLLNPWYFLVGGRGIEPLASSVSTKYGCIS
jgi:hypothetical protein